MFKILKYGLLPDPLVAPNGFVYGGTGNLPTGFHGIENHEPIGLAGDWLKKVLTGQSSLFQELKLAATPVLHDAAWLKVHLRQGADIAPTDSDGDEYHFVGGFQPGNPTRLNVNVDAAFFDHDNSIKGSAFGWDLDTSDGEDILWYDHYDAATHTLTARHDDGSLHVVQMTGNGAEAGDSGWLSFNGAFVLDKMYNGETGEAWNGTDAADIMVYARTVNEGPIAALPSLGSSTIETSVHLVIDSPAAIEAVM